MTKIYDQHRDAFQLVSAYVITDKKGNRVGTVAIKFPKDGAGRLYAYVHFIGLEMTRAMAGGYGYDKRSPAVQNAVLSIVPKDLTQSESYSLEYDKKVNAALKKFKAGFAEIGGQDWTDVFRLSGFNVLQAV